MCSIPRLWDSLGHFQRLVFALLNSICRHNSPGLSAKQGQPRGQRNPSTQRPTGIWSREKTGPVTEVTIHPFLRLFTTSLCRPHAPTKQQCPRSHRHKWPPGISRREKTMPVTGVTILPVLRLYATKACRSPEGQSYWGSPLSTFKPFRTDPASNASFRASSAQRPTGISSREKTGPVSGVRSILSFSCLQHQCADSSRGAQSLWVSLVGRGRTVSLEPSDCSFHLQSQFFRARSFRYRGRAVPLVPSVFPFSLILQVCRTSSAKPRFSFSFQAQLALFTFVYFVHTVAR